MPMLPRLDAVYVELSGPDPASLNGFEAQSSFSAERVKGGDETFPVRSRVSEGAHQHVSTDAREGVKIADPGH
jgi:hypothetical protein